MKSISKITKALLGGGWLVLLLVVALAGPAAAQLNPGDILVAQSQAFGPCPVCPGPGMVIRVDPVIGAQTIISSGGNFVGPVGIAIAANGDILVADADAFGGPGGVIRVDPVTGAQTTISSGGLFVCPTGIALEASGDILVADHCALAVIRVNPLTGAQSVVSSGGFFVGGPSGITVAPDGSIYCGDVNATGIPPFDNAGNSGGAIIRVDPVTGAQTIISSFSMGPPLGRGI